MYPFSAAMAAHSGSWIFEPSLAFAALPHGAQYAFAAVFGLVIGSFLTVVVHRVPIMLDRAWREDLQAYQDELRDSHDNDANNGDDAINDKNSNHVAHASEPGAGRAVALASRYNLAVPRSACPACGHTLRAHENIPVLSYVLQRGRCTACGARFGWRYPLLELATALCAMLSLSAFGPTLAALAAFGFCAAALAMSAIDLDTRLLPDSLTLPLLWAGLLLNLQPTFATLDQAVIGAVTGYLSLWLVHWVFRLVRGRDGMGYGDFKLLAAIGAWLGWVALPQVLLLASVSGAIAGLIATWTRRMRLQEPLPFGPFLSGAAAFTLFCGEPLYRWIGG
jgi:leader peptidase (prepilin peptidase)/N-methyltransferase